MVKLCSTHLSKHLLFSSSGKKKRGRFKRKNILAAFLSRPGGNVEPFSGLMEQASKQASQERRNPFSLSSRYCPKHFQHILKASRQTDSPESLDTERDASMCLPVQIFLSPTVVLLSFYQLFCSRTIADITTGSQNKIWTGLGSNSFQARPFSRYTPTSRALLPKKYINISVQKI